MGYWLCCMLLYGSTSHHPGRGIYQKAAFWQVIRGMPNGSAHVVLRISRIEKGKPNAGIVGKGLSCSDSSVGDN